MSKDRQTLDNPAPAHDAMAIALVGAGMAALQPIDVAGTPAVLLPAGSRLELLPDLRETPPRAEIDVHFSDVAHLLAYLDEHDAGRTAVFVNPQDGTTRAFLDYHRVTGELATPIRFREAGWLRHRASFSLTEDVRWKIWKGNNGKPMPQDAFAEFLEDNAEDVVKPDAARLIEIVTNFKATKNLVFKSAQNTQNGEVKITFDESIEAGGGRLSRLEIPEQFEIGLHLFDGLSAYKLKARFRYRVDDAGRKIMFSYQLIRPQLSERDAVMQIVKQIEESRFASYRVQRLPG